MDDGSVMDIDAVLGCPLYLFEVGHNMDYPPKTWPQSPQITVAHHPPAAPSDSTAMPKTRSSRVTRPPCGLWVQVDDGGVGTDCSTVSDGALHLQNPYG